jgi:hypothetical protein
MIALMSVRGLVPYALAAVLVAAGSSLAVVSTVHHVAGGPIASASITPGPSGARVADLSRSSRLAYWREGKLWVSNLDGSLRHALASTEDIRRISLTRWTPDGGSVAFVETGLSLVVVAADGTRTEVALPFELRVAGYRIADVRWSPDGRRAATTLLRANDGRSDAFVVDLNKADPSFARATTLEDLFVSDWISRDEFLAYTATGVIAIVRAGATDQVRLLTGATGVSPIIGPEGRIHFLVGRISLSRDPSLAYVTAIRAVPYSAATDGSDVRREATWEVNDIRLDVRLPDGRYLVHRGSTNAQGTVTDDVQNLPANAGVIERIRSSPDGRSAYGFTGERIVRVDLTKLGPPPATQAANDAVSVFLDTSGEADVWFPTQLSLARGGERPPAAPSARYAFQFGGHVWQMENGVATLVHPGPVARRTPTPAPRWAPGGERFVALEQAGPDTPPTTLVALAIDRAGAATRLAPTVGAGRSFAWAPGGNEVAIAVDKKGVSGIASDAQLEIRFVDPTGRATRAPIAANEVAWTTAGLYLLGEGGAVQKLVGDGPAKPIVTKDKIIADPRADPSRIVASSVSGLDAAPDGSVVSVRLQVQDPASSNRAYVVLISPDGGLVQYVRADTLSDAAWSPARALLGYTLDVRTSSERAVIYSPADGKPVATVDGRFAGWSPDAQWYYVGRVTGLYAFKLGGGDPVRVGPIGLPMTAAPR